MNAKRKVIIDCDPGIDDALALMLAVSSPELDILGITIVCGNVPTALGAENALKVLSLMNRLDIPIYLGETAPLTKPFVSAQETHGFDGLGETNLPTLESPRPKNGAVDFIIRTLSENTQVSIIALGPLTNLAKALMKDQSAFNTLDEFITMGGNYRSHGNCSPVAEYNYWCDPHSAKYVYGHLGKLIHMVGLDVTRQVVLTPNILQYIQYLDTEKSKFIKDITRFYLDFHWQYEQLVGCVINDPLAVAYFIDKDLCRGFDAFTTIETDGICLGQSVVDAMHFWKKESNSHVLIEVDTYRFMHLFLSRLFNIDTHQLSHVLNQLMIQQEVHYDYIKN